VRMMCIKIAEKVSISGDAPEADVIYTSKSQTDRTLYHSARIRM
jgi:hypothetical protein